MNPKQKKQEAHFQNKTYFKRFYSYSFHLLLGLEFYNLCRRIIQAEQLSLAVSHSMQQVKAKVSLGIL